LKDNSELITSAFEKAGILKAWEESTLRAAYDLALQGKLWPADGSKMTPTNRAAAAAAKLVTTRIAEEVPEEEVEPDPVKDGTGPDADETMRALRHWQQSLRLSRSSMKQRQQQQKQQASL
jgi:hypothetical protein